MNTRSRAVTPAESSVPARKSPAQPRELTYHTATWRVTRNPRVRFPGLRPNATQRSHAGDAIWRRRYISLDITIWRKEAPRPSAKSKGQMPKATWRVVIL